MSADKMVFDARTMEEIIAMQPEEKLEAIRKSIYSDDDLLRLLMKVIAAAAPEAMPDFPTWVTLRFPQAPDEF